MIKSTLVKDWVPSWQGLACKYRSGSIMMAEQEQVRAVEINGTITSGTRYWYEVLIDGKQFIYTNKGFTMYIVPEHAPQVSQNVWAVPTNGSVRKGGETDR